MKMKNINIILASAAVLLGFAACVKEQAEEIQGVNAKIDGVYVNKDKQSEEYFESIRAYKKGPHVLCFGFYAAWHALEGSRGEVASPASWGQRVKGLPDSLDIADLWMGIPTGDPAHAEENDLGLEYCPVTHADIKYCQEKLGTKFVSHEDMSHNQVFTWGTWTDETTGEVHPLYYNILKGRGSNTGRVDDFTDDIYGKPSVGYDEDHPIGGNKGQGYKESCIAYARRCLERMRVSGIDGIDFDYEPNDATWNTTTAAYVAEELAKFIGPETGEYTVANYPQKDTTKLLMFNFFGNSPGQGVEPYMNYLVDMCYAWQIGTEPSGWVGRRPGWCPKEKFILNDSLGGEAHEAYLYGGKLSHYVVDGVDSRMYSMEAMARLVKDQGFAGFGAYYLDRNYMSASGIPYRELRRDICIANGADLPPYYVNE